MKKILNIGIVDIKSKIGGVRTFIDNFYKALKKYTNHNVSLIDFNNTSLSELNSYDILHFSTIPLKKSWKLFFLNNPQKILTVHGWVKQEFLLNLNSLNILKKVNYFLQVINFKLFIKINYFDKITCPTKNTAEKNNLKKAIIITNAIFPEDYKNEYHKNNKIIFITYSSKGGDKNKKIFSLIKIIKKIIKIHSNVELHIYGEYEKKINSNNIFFHGYTKDFLKQLKKADLFITLKGFPDLGYVEMESGALKIPIAKLKTSNYEEIIDNKTGILADNNRELLKKLTNYINHLQSKKKYLGNNLYILINKEKNWKNVISEWDFLFKELIKK